MKYIRIPVSILAIMFFGLFFKAIASTHSIESNNWNKMASGLNFLQSNEPLHQQLIAGYQQQVLPEDRCSENAVMTGIFLRRRKVNQDFIDTLPFSVVEPIEEITEIKPLCNTLKLNKRTLRFDTEVLEEQPSFLSSRENLQDTFLYSCPDNQVVVGIRSWNNEALVQQQALNPSLTLPSATNVISESLSDIELICASLELRGDYWISADEPNNQFHKKAATNNQPVNHKPQSGNDDVYAFCFEPGKNAVTGFEIRTQSYSLSPKQSLVIQDESDLDSLGLYQHSVQGIELKCQTLIPTWIDKQGDEDQDGLSNFDEIRIGTSFLTEDTDQDNKSDLEEFNRDTDRDGVSDAIESDMKDQDKDGVADEYDGINNNPCIPYADNEACQYRLLNLDGLREILLGDNVKPSLIDQLRLPNFALFENCDLENANRKLSCTDFMVQNWTDAEDWRDHYNASSMGFYRFSWFKSRQLGALLGGFQVCLDSSSIDDCDISALKPMSIRKKIRVFSNGSKATGVLGSEIKTILQQAKPLNEHLSAKYYSGNENWDDYIGMMYFDLNNKLEAITLSKAGDYYGRTLVVLDDKGSNTLHFVDEDYIYYHF